MTRCVISLSVPDEYLSDVEWGKKQNHPRGLSGFMLDLLHETRVKVESSKLAEKEQEIENAVPDSEEARSFYTSIFGFIREQDEDDRDFCGGDRTRAVLAVKQLFLEVTKRKPELYEYCKAVFEIEHPYLFRLWQNQHSFI